MIVGDIMTRYVEFIDADATICEAAALMGELDVGALPVGSAENTVGILTQRDILYRVVAKCLDNAAVKVGDVATRTVIGCSEYDTLQAAMDVMAAHNIRRLPVRRPDAAVVGWITLADLARSLLLKSELVQSGLRDLTEARD